LRSRKNQPSKEDRIKEMEQGFDHDFRKREAMLRERFRRKKNRPRPFHLKIGRE